MATVNQGTIKNKSSQPILSIIIPHHGGFDILNSCLSSLQNSTFIDYEIIIVDNNSQDNSIVKIKEKFPYINILSIDCLLVAGALWK